MRSRSAGQLGASISQDSPSRSFRHLSQKKQTLLQARHLAERLRNIPPTWNGCHGPSVEERLQQQSLGLAGRSQHAERTLFPRSRCHSVSLIPKEADEEDMAARHLRDGFNDVQQDLLKHLERHRGADFADYMLNDGQVKHLRQRVSQKRAAKLSSLGEALVVPAGGEFSHGPVVVEMSTKASGCVVEFQTTHAFPDGWQRRMHLKPQQQEVCTCHRPLVLEEAGEWTVSVRLRQVASDSVSEWQTYNFKIEHGAVADKKVPVIRCIVRTKLDMMSSKFDTSSYNACQHAMEQALGVPSLVVRVMQASFKWPEVDIHFAIYSSSGQDIGSSQWLHPMEQVLHKLREPQLIPVFAERLQKEHVQIRAGETGLLRIWARTLVCHELSGFINRDEAQELEDNASKRRREWRQSEKRELCRLRLLCLQVGRVQSKAQFASEGRFTEGLFSLPIPLFKSLLEFL